MRVAHQQGSAEAVTPRGYLRLAPAWVSSLLSRGNVCARSLENHPLRR